MGRRRTVPPAGSPSTGDWQSGLSPFELLAAVTVAIVLVGAGLVWATAQLTGRVTSGAWLELGLADTVMATLRLTGTAGQPDRAFPLGVRSAIPAAWVFWSTFTALLVAPVVSVGSLAARWRRGRADGEPGSARWSTPRDIRPLVVDKPQPGRLTLGVGPRRKLLACEPGHSLLVLGPTQSGKTSGLAIPAIREWDGPVLATSVKADLLEHSYPDRQDRGDVRVYDPTRSVDGIDPASWTPLATCTTWQGALRTATWLTEAGRDANLRGSDFWYTSAAKVLAPLLFAAATDPERDMADLIRWVDTQEIEQVLVNLELAGVPEAIHAAEATFRREERTRSSIYTTVENLLRAFYDPGVAASARGCDIDADRLLDGPNTLYICAPLHEQDRLRPLFVTLIHTVLNAAYDRTARTGPLASRLLVVLDEAANIAPLPDLAQIASTAAGLGIQLVTIWQDRSQIVTRYGQSAGTVINNHRAKLLLSGIYDPATTNDASTAIGDAEVMRRSTTIGFDGRLSSTDAMQRQPLASPSALRQLEPFEGVLIYGRLPPTRLRLRPPTTRRH